MECNKWVCLRYFENKYENLLLVTLEMASLSEIQIGQPPPNTKEVIFQTRGCLKLLLRTICCQVTSKYTLPFTNNCYTTHKSFSPIYWLISVEPSKFKVFLQCSSIFFIIILTRWPVVFVLSLEKAKDHGRISKCKTQLSDVVYELKYQ